MSDPCKEGHSLETWRGRDICIVCGYSETPGMKEPNLSEGITEHDHLCISKSKDLSSPITCTYCQLIRAVRAEYVN